MGCVACEGSAFFCSIFPIIFVGQSRFLSFSFSIFPYEDSQEYPKRPFPTLYEEELKTLTIRKRKDYGQENRHGNVIE